MDQINVFGTLCFLCSLIVRCANDCDQHIQDNEHGEPDEGDEEKWAHDPVGTLQCSKVEVPEQSKH